MHSASTFSHRSDLLAENRRNPRPRSAVDFVLAAMGLLTLLAFVVPTLVHAANLTQGGPAPSTGENVRALPLPLPPGVGGVEPSLALLYGHRAGIGDLLPVVDAAQGDEAARVSPSASTPRSACHQGTEENYPDRSSCSEATLRARGSRWILAPRSETEATAPCAKSAAADSRTLHTS